MRRTRVRTTERDLLSLGTVSVWSGELHKKLSKYSNGTMPSTIIFSHIHTTDHGDTVGLFSHCDITDPHGVILRVVAMLYEELIHNSC